MNYREQFDQISTFLAPLKKMWENEILCLYPNDLDCFNTEWMRQLASLNEEELWQVDCHASYSVLKESEFAKWIETIQELSIIEQSQKNKTTDLPDWAFNKVKGKKRHEILILAEVFKKIQDAKPFSHLVDIGGGVGHLARIMAHYKGIECISLDINEEFQKFGTKRMEKYPRPSGAKEVSFITHDFTEELEGDLTKKIFSKDSFSLGLHTCGPLANRHIDCAIKNETRGLLNFGCCYNRLDPKTDINLSSHAQGNGLTGLNHFSFTLATRGHSSMNFEDFKHKRRVKNYRYALHLFLHDEMGIKGLTPVGDSHQRDYWASFSSYAQKKLDGKEIKYDWSSDQFDEFYSSKETQETLDKLFYANIIRWQLGRILELYILLDRVLYIQEQGKTPQLLKFFDEELSPRNIGVLFTE